MYSEVLDDGSEDKHQKTKFGWKSRVVLFILWLSSILIFIGSPYFHFEFVWSLLGLSMATYYVIVNSSISVYATFILLGLGVFGFVNHFNFIFHLSIGRLNLNLIYVVLLILHAILNTNEWLEFLRTLLRAKTRKGVSNTVSIDENRFMTKYKGKTKEELTSIIQGSHYSKEAKEAAKELLKKEK